MVVVVVVGEFVVVVVLVVVVVSSVEVVLKPLVGDSIEAVDAERQRQSNKDRKS